MIIEVIRFTLRDGVGESALLKAIEASYVEFLQTQPGFVGRELFKADDGSWMGLLRWESLEAAQRADAAWDKHPLSAKLDTLADPTSVSITRCTHVLSQP
jgi:hypothetical protein